MSALREWDRVNDRRIDDDDPASPSWNTDEGDSPSAALSAVPGVPAARRAPFVMLMLLLLGGGLTGLLLLNTQLQQGTFALSTLQAEEGALTDQAQSLGLQADAMQAPAALQSAAAALGMIPAEFPQFLDVRRQRLSGAPAVTGIPVVLTPAQIAQAKARAAARARAEAKAAAKAKAEARVKAAAKAKAAAAAKAKAAEAAAAARARAEAKARASAKPTPSAPAKPTSPATPTSPVTPAPKATR